jgi:hypothetical protein
MAVNFRDQEENITEARAGLLKVKYFDLRGQNTTLLENVLDPKEMRALKIAPLERTPTHLIFAFTVETNKSTIEKIKLLSLIML